jgi:lambda family phage tail tape measure protein
MAQTSRLVIELDSRDAEAKAADTRKALEALEDAGLSIQPALNKAGAGMEKMGKGAEKATKSIENEADELERLLGQIDPVTRRLGELDKQEQDLAKHRKAGKLDAATYDEYQAKINQTRVGLTRFDDSLTRTGNTAKQTAAALRGVPAQFTDIAVSLQGGQNPLTVFLQQGGQLKDMFGGAGPAAKALGGYVLGLVNPFTVAAAAVGTLGLAYYQGSQEADAFRQAIITTGNASGTSALALAGMATTISATVGTTGKAAETLALLASNGKIASSSFEQIATAAIGFEQVTGKAVSSTVAEFAALAEDPVKTLATLNDKYNFLTASVYEQVRAAQQMGETEQAAAIAQAAYAKALEDRTKTIKESLGTIETAWNAITGAAKSGWDAMLGVGRQQSLDEQIANTKQLLEDRKTSFAAKMFPDTLGEGSDSTRFLQTRLNLLEKQKLLLTDQGKAEGENARIQREGQQAFEEFSKGVEAAGSREQKLNKALLEDQKRINAARAAGYTITQADADASEKAIRDKFKEPKSATPKAYSEDAGMKMLDSSRQAYAVLVQQNAAISEQGTKNEKLGAQAQALLRWEQQLADLKSKGALTADQKALLASQDLITAQLKKNSALEKEVELRKASKEEAEKLSAFQTNQSSRLGTAQDGLDSQVAGMGLGSEARDRLKQDLAIQRDYARQSADLLEQRNTGRITQDLYDKESAVIQDGLNKRLAMQQNYYAQIDTYQSNWINGVTAGWNSYAEISQNTAQQTQDIVTGSLDALTTGFGNSFSAMALDGATFSDVLSNTFEGLVRGVLDGLGQMGAQWLINQGIQLAFGQTETALHIAKMARIGTETAAETASAATVATAKVAADGVSTASSLAATATTTTAQVAAAGTTLASWLPAALVASIGSFGAAAVVGGGALLAAFALIKGFSNGGYTGAGGVNEPAGTVHKGEVVWSQADIRKAGGVATVEAMRKGNVSAGLPASSGGSTSAGNGVPAPERPLVVNLHEDASRAGQVSRTQLSEQDVVDIYVSNISSEGQIHEANQSKYGLKSQGA